jgi:carotenoid cleavage dioxygenase-like enzyme
VARVVSSFTHTRDNSAEPGTANTALEYHNSRMLALVENSRPTEVFVHRSGKTEALGIQDYDGKLRWPMTAHPKVDPATQELMVRASWAHICICVSHRAVRAVHRLHAQRAATVCTLLCR